MKRIMITVLVFIFLCPVIGNAMEVSGQYACLIEAATGRVVYEKNADQKYSMASTTKIMTALVAIEEQKLNDIVTVSKNASIQEGSCAYIAEGDKILMSDLLYGLMLNSGNDAAMAVAEHISGKPEAFAELMTKKAHELGAVNTQFKNPSGLDADGHYTTAKDLALIAREALKNPVFTQIVQTRTKQVPVQNTGRTLYFANHNKMLNLYQGAIGVKTGYTKATGRCLVSAAQRNGVTLIAVTLNAPDDWNDHIRMLDYGFEQFEPRALLTQGQVLKTVSLDGNRYEFAAKENFSVPMKKNDAVNAEIVLHMIENIKAPVNAGEKVGYAEILCGGASIGKVDIISVNDILQTAPLRMKASFFDHFSKVMKKWLV